MDDPKDPSLDKSGRSSGLRNGLDPLRLAVPKKDYVFLKKGCVTHYYNLPLKRTRRNLQNT